LLAFAALSVKEVALSFLGKVCTGRCGGIKAHRPPLRVLRVPVSGLEDDFMRLVDDWPGSLEAYGLQISTGPVVPFRATEFIDKVGQVPGSHVPLIWMNHVQPMRVTWPLGRHKLE
jgi:hypothetical protein